MAGNTDASDGSSADIRTFGPMTAQSSLVGDNSSTSLPAAPLGAPDINGNLIGTHDAPIAPSSAGHREVRAGAKTLGDRRTNAWTVRCRRNDKDYERRVESSEAMIQLSNIHVMLRRLAPTARPSFNYRNAA